MRAARIDGRSDALYASDVFAAREMRLTIKPVMVTAARVRDRVGLRRTVYRGGSYGPLPRARTRDGAWRGNFIGAAHGPASLWDGGAPRYRQSHRDRSAAVAAPGLVCPADGVRRCGRRGSCRCAGGVAQDAGWVSRKAVGARAPLRFREGGAARYAADRPRSP